MKAKWLIEKDLFIDTEDRLIEILQKFNLEYKTVNYSPLQDVVEHCEKLFPDKEDCVIFYGSLNYGRKLKQLSWIPGVYLNEKMYECTSYYPKFGNELLHHNYIMMPFGDLVRRKDFLFEYFGEKIFIRPNSGFKQFTGSVIKDTQFEDWMKLAGFYEDDVESNLLVVVSDVKDLIREWRFVVVNQEIISGSLYRDWTFGGDKSNSITNDYVLLNSKEVIEECNNSRAWDYAKRMAKKINPEAVWTLDIAELETLPSSPSNLFKVIEIGCFSCAGMYGNDLDKVVKAVSNAAENEWNEYQII